MNQALRQSIELQINRLKNLPALPEASVKILDAINNPNISIDKLAEVLSLSPGLVARLLGLANSAYFGKSREITEIRSAIFQVLGLDLVKSLALGVVVNVQFDTSKCTNFKTGYFWNRSLVTAVAAQKLAERHNFHVWPPSTVYNCGLLLYIGILVTAYLFPEELNAVIFRCGQPGQPKISQELADRLGWSHYQMGYQLLRKWQLSSVYQSLLQHYEQVPQPAEAGRLQGLVKTAQSISSLLVDGCNPELDVFARLAADSSLSEGLIEEIFLELHENRQNIQQMAQIMGE